jgi:hypothetical protein
MGSGDSRTIDFAYDGNSLFIGETVPSTEVTSLATD